MNATEARHLLAYTRWANDLILDAIAGLDEEQLTRDLKSSFPSIRATLAHLAGADWLWIERWEGRSHNALPDEWNGFDFAQLAARWRQVQDQRLALFATAGDNDIRRVIAYRNLRGEHFEARLDSLLRHAINHSTYHRGQLTTMLRQVGAQPPSTDLVVYERMFGTPD